MTRIGVAALEPSADHLAAGLVRALVAQDPAAQVSGLGGTAFGAAGATVIESADTTAVMGLVEVVAHLPRLLALRGRLARHFLGARPDVFVGVDAPDFNIGLDLRLRRAGIRTVQYVGPSVWAWRRYRLRTLARAVDRVLVLFPFEQQVYEAAGVPCTYVGHPLADQVPMAPDRDGARRRLQLAHDARVVALLPGSRDAELTQHAGLFIDAAAHVARRLPDARFVSSLATEAAARSVRAALQRRAGAPAVTVYCGRMADVLSAADVAIVASGTATFEAMLYKVPMVVAYRMNPVSFHIIRSLVRVRYAALPNLICDAEVVPELLQDRCRPLALADATLRWLGDAAAMAALREEFARRHATLRCGASARAAAAVLAVARGE
jgi:lipid-A-disaccharide synthase